jgi:mycofactocin precursor
MYSYSSPSAETKENDMPDAELLERPADLPAQTEITDVEPAEVVAADLLVEEISIDGMCGVY